MSADFVPITPGSGANVETQTQADGTKRQVVSAADFKAALDYALECLLNPLHVNGQCQMRVSIEAIAGALTLSTITTVGTVTTVSTVTTVTTVGVVTNLAQIGARDASTLIDDSMSARWANCVRGRVA